jgi:hypothetical protein
VSDSKLTKTFAHRATDATRQGFAHAKVTGVSGASTDRVNCTGVTRTGAGAYTVTLSPGIPLTDRHISLTLREAGIIYLATAGNSTSFGVATQNDAGAPTDLDWEFSVFRTQPA